MNVNAKIGAKIKRARRLMVPEMTQDELGKRIGLSRRSIQLIESGEKRIYVDVLVQIAFEINKPITFFFED